MKSILTFSKEDTKKFNARLSRYLNFSEDTHKILTPLHICEEMILKIHNTKKFNNDSKVLILCNVEFISVLYMLYNILNINMDNVYFITICDKKSKWVNNLTKNVKVYNNYKEFFKDTDLPKFDVIIGNPPYNANMHLKFLDKAYDLCSSTGSISIVHPGVWLYAQKPGNSMALNSKANYLKNKIGDNFESFEFINGNRIFGIGLFGPCVITTINKSKTISKFKVIDREKNTTTVYSDLNFNPFFETSGIFESIKNKIWTYCKQNNIHKNTEFYTNIKDFKESKFYLNVPIISGHISTNGNGYLADDFFQLLNKKHSFVSTKYKTRDCSVNGKQVTAVLKFEDELVGNNCLDYLLNSKLAKFALMIVKTGQNLDKRETEYVPYFDFTQKWNDDKIYKLLNLTNEEIQYIKTKTI